MRLRLTRRDENRGQAAASTRKQRLGRRSLSPIFVKAMLVRTLWLCCLGWAGAGLAQEPFNNASLNGKYHFVQLLVTALPGQAAAVRTLGGSITFNGAGSYSYAVEGSSGGQGVYGVGGAGNVLLASPIRSEEWVSAALGADRSVLVGASVETSGVTYDLLVAVRAPAAGVGNALLSGAYTGAWFELPARSALISLAPNGNGKFTQVAVLGHAADQGGRTVRQQAANASYNLRAAGTGTASFGATASLFSGDREILVSEDGNYLLGYSGRGILIASRNSGSAIFEGRYWIAELTVEGSSYSAASGSLRALGNGRAVISERLRLDRRVLDYAGVNSYTVSPDSTGALAPRLSAGLINMALGAGGTFVGAQIGPPDAATPQYGIFFGVRAPVVQGTGVFLDPAGVVNGASFAPAPHPIAPGSAVSLFGSGLASREAKASAFPLPAKLDDVAVRVNGTPVPLFFISPAQVSVQLPYGLKGNTVTVQVTNSKGNSGEVTARLAPTSPGIFSYADGQNPSRGIVLHADYSLVTPPNPAHPGETVILYLTGLGELTPPLATGVASPDAPLPWAQDTLVSVVFGGEVSPKVLYAGGAPRFAGLNQINAVIPFTAPLGASVPVAISTSNAYVDLVDIPILR